MPGDGYEEGADGKCREEEEEKGGHLWVRPKRTDEKLRQEMGTLHTIGGFLEKTIREQGLKDKREAMLYLYKEFRERARKGAGEKCYTRKEKAGDKGYAGERFDLKTFLPSYHQERTEEEIRKGFETLHKIGELLDRTMEEHDLPDRAAAIRFYWKGKSGGEARDEE